MALFRPQLTGILFLLAEQYRKAVKLEFYKMATKAQVSTVLKSSAAAPAPVVQAPVVQAPVVQAPQAPLFTLGHWPVKSQGGNTVRAYCYTVAKALAKAHPEGFTVAAYASALASNAAGSTMRQPSGGWGTSAKPNGAAMQHANWFSHAKQGWLSPVAPAPAEAPAKA